MPSYHDAWLRQQQSRWLRPDGDRWVRPDAARFLAPGADITKAFPVLARKYSPNQPRVPAGNPDGGQWTDGAVTGGISSGRLGRDAAIAEEVGNLGLFEITPRQNSVQGVQLAGDPPEKLPPIIVTPEEPEPSRISDQGASSPEIPSRLPDTTEERMRFVRSAVRWIRVVGRYSPLADIFFGAADQIREINRLTDMIRSANDPPMTLDKLQDRPALPGYQRHHIAEEAAARDAGDPEKLIQGRDNTVRIPTLQHIEISRYYATQVKQNDGTKLSPRDMLKGQSFEIRRQYGLEVLKKYGVLK